MLTKIRVEGESVDPAALRVELRSALNVVRADTCRASSDGDAQPHWIVDEHYELMDMPERHTEDEWYRGRVVATFGQTSAQFDAMMAVGFRPVVTSQTLEQHPGMVLP